MKKYSYSILIIIFVQTLIMNHCLSQTQKGMDIDGLAAYDYAGVVCMPDANTLAVGAPVSSGAPFPVGPGNVRVYSWQETEWIQKGSTISGESTRDEFGYSISMPNSNTLAVGAPSEDEAGADAGHVRVFAWDGNDWIQKGLDIDGQNLGDQSGNAVSMPDENTVAVGARRQDINGVNTGGVRVYEWDGTAWIQKGSTLAGTSTEDLFGTSVSMPDANTVAAGAHLNDGNGNASGQVKIFEWNGSDWAQKGVTLFGEGVVNRFGESISMPNANCIVAGAPGNQENGEYAGHIRMFEWNGSSWIQKGNDIDGDEGEQLGYSVSAPTPNTIAAGSISNSSAGENAGAVKIFEWNGSGWIQKGLTIDGEAEFNGFGLSVSMPDPGNFVGGSKLNYDGGSNAGHARVFTFCDSPVTAVDIQSACDSFTWIDNVTYTSSNNTATWTLTSVEGCDSIVTLNLTIGDEFQPIPDIAELEDVVSECALESLTAPTATDECVGELSGIHDAIFPITESTTITWTYDDGNGNTSTQTQEVIIDDTTAPEADEANLEDVTAECELTSLITPTATDNCLGEVMGTHDAIFPITESTAITWTYDDGNGNTSTQTQEVIIDDTTAPEADAANLEDLTAECELTSLITPTATDNCVGEVMGTHDAIFPITESTTITWTYTDGNGNTSTQTQEVIITPIDNGISQLDDTILSADASGYSYQWVDCENENEAIEGEIDQTFEVASNGIYAVIVDNGECSVMSDCIEVIVISVNETIRPSLVIYPNPARRTVYIDGRNQVEDILLFNSLSQRIEIDFNKENQTFQLPASIERGIYFVRLILDDSYEVHRLLVD